MANDGTLKFDTLIDSKGFQKGINAIGDIAQRGLQATADILKGSMTAIGGLGAAAVKVGSDFESGMSKVSAIAGKVSDQDLPAIVKRAEEMGLSFAEGVNATETAMNILSAKAKEMGSTTKFSATESAAAFEYMAMAGWKTEDMLGGIEGIMRLAAASGEELATTSDIVTDALTAFGMTADDAGHFADVLAQASSNANTNVGMMGETFKYVAPVAGALGYTAEDTAMAIGLMANAGIKGSQAGTSLRSMMSRLTKPTKEVGTAMDALGVSLTNSDGSMKNLNEVMRDLREGFNGLSEAESAELASMLAGQEAMSGLLAIVNASGDDFSKLEDSIYSCYGAAARMAETMSDNLQGQITILKSGLEGLGISFYENIQTPLKDIAVEAQEMVGELQDAFDSGGLDGLVTAFGDILSRIVEGVAGAAPDLIEAATGLVGSFCDSLKNSPTVGDAAAVLITSLVTGFLSCAGDIWTTAITLVGKMAQGIAAGAPQMVQAASTVLADFIECIAGWMPEVLRSGADVIMALVEGIADALPVLISQAALIVTDLAMALVDNLPALVDAALDMVMGLVQGLVDGLPILLEGAIQLFMAILEALPVIIERLLQVLPELITTIIDFFTDNHPLVIDGAIQMFMGIIDAIPVIIQAIVENLPQIITALVEGLVGALPQILQAAITLLMAIIQAIPDIVVAIAENLPRIIMAIATGMVDAIPAIFTAAKDLLWQIITAIPDIVTGIGEAVPEIISGIVAGLANGMSSVFDKASELGSGLFSSIVENIRFLPKKVSQILSDTLSRLVSWGTELLAAGVGAAGNTVSGVVDFFAGLPERMAYWLGYAIGTVIQWGIDLINWVITEVPAIIDSIVTFFSELPGKIQTWLVDTVTKVIQWGTELYSTISTAAQNAVNKAAEWFRQLPGKIWTWLVSTVAKVTQFAADLKAKATSAAQGFVTNLVNGIKGLPDKFREIGSNIVSGIWNGISSGWSWLVDKVKGLADSLFQGAKDALGIHSPSKVFEQEVGQWIPPGIGVGIEKAMPDLQKQVDAEMEELAGRMQTAVAIETGGITVRTRARAEHDADTEYPKGGGDTYIDQHLEQENNYHVPVATPSETSRAQREAARKLLGGIH